MTQIRYVSIEDGEVGTAYTEKEINNKEAAMDYLQDNDYCARSIISIQKGL